MKYSGKTANINVIRNAYYIHGPELIKLVIFVMNDWSYTLL